MSSITKHELAYHFETTIAERLRSLKVPKAKAVAVDLTPRLLSEVPTEAFEPTSAWERGILYFHGGVDEARVRDMQDQISAAHINVKAGIPLQLYVSSPGGDANAGMALFSTIQEVRRAGRVVNGHVQGEASSMGAVLIQACDLRTIEPFAFLMVHEVWDNPEGKTSHINDYVAFLNRYENILSGIYASRSGRTAEWWREKIARRDVYLTAREALAFGLVDKIRPITPYPKKETRRKRDDAVS